MSPVLIRNALALAVALSLGLAARERNSGATAAATAAAAPSAEQVKAESARLEVIAYPERLSRHHIVDLCLAANNAS